MCLLLLLPIERVARIECKQASLIGADPRCRLSLSLVDFSPHLFCSVFACRLDECITGCTMRERFFIHSHEINVRLFIASIHLLALLSVSQHLYKMCVACLHLRPLFFCFSFFNCDFSCLTVTSSSFLHHTRVELIFCLANTRCILNMYNLAKNNL